MYTYIYVHKICVHTSCKDTFFNSVYIILKLNCFRLSNSYVDTGTGAGIGAGIDTGRGTDRVTGKHIEKSGREYSLWFRKGLRLGLFQRGIQHCQIVKCL